QVTKNTVVPSGYSVSIDQDPIIARSVERRGGKVSDAEVGATYDYTFSSGGGGTDVTGTGTISTETDQVSGINLTGLGDGTITLSVTLTNGNGTGVAVGDQVTKNTVVPSGYSVSINQDPIIA